jgi:hypothetical protein
MIVVIKKNALNANKFYEQYKEHLGFSLMTFYRMMRKEEVSEKNIKDLEDLCAKLGYTRKVDAYTDAAYLRTLITILDRIINASGEGVIDDTGRGIATLLGYYKKNERKIKMVVENISRVTV